MKVIYDRINKSPISFGEERYDYTVMIGVHSQLNTFFERIWGIFLGIAQEKDNSVAEFAAKENDIYIPRVNSGLFKMTRKSSFVGFELIESENGSRIQGAVQAIRDIGTRIEAKELICQQRMDAIWPLREGLAYSMGVMKLDICP